MKTYYKLALILLTVLPSLTFAQQKNLSLGVQTGFYQFGYFKDMRSGENFSLELAYRFKKRYIISYHSSLGFNTYTEPISLTGVLKPPTFNSNGTNAKSTCMHIGGLFGYTIPLIEKSFFRVMIGVSIYNEILKIPYRDGNLIDYKNEIHTNFAFPVKGLIGFSPSKKMEVGLAGGCYLDSFKTQIGYYVGPQVNFRF